MTGKSVDSVFTEYAKVTGTHLVQLEIHVLGDTSQDGKDAATWFNKRTHVEEISVALMPVMLSRVNCVCERKSEKRSRKETKTFQVDAPSLRLAYRFKQRNSSNQCILINCFETNLRSRRHRSLQVFSEKLVVHAYHRKGFRRLEAIYTNNDKALLDFKDDEAAPSTLLTLRSKSTASVYFNKRSSSPQLQQLTLRDIIKKSGPKLSKSRRRQTVEDVDSVDSLWTSMEDEVNVNEVTPSKPNRVLKVSDTSEVNLVTAIEDSGFCQEEMVAAESSSVVTSGSSQCSTSDPRSGVTVEMSEVNPPTQSESSSEGTSHRKTRSVMQSMQYQKNSTSPGPHMTAQSRPDIHNYGNCTSDRSDLKEKFPKDVCCIKEKYHKDKCLDDKCPMFSKDKSSKDNIPKNKCFKDSCPKNKCLEDKYTKDECLRNRCHNKTPQDKTTKDTTQKDKTPKAPQDNTSKDKTAKDTIPKDKTPKAPQDNTSKDKTAKDTIPKDKTPKANCAKEQQTNSRGKLISSQQDCYNVTTRPPKGGMKEQRKLRLKKRATPTSQVASPNSSNGDIPAVDNGSPAWKMSPRADRDRVRIRTSPEKSVADKSRWVEKRKGNFRGRNLTCSGAISPGSHSVSKSCNATSPNVKRSADVVVTARRAGLKCATKTTTSIRVMQQRKKVSSKLEKALQVFEADCSSNTATARNGEQTCSKGQKTSEKLATLLKEFEEDAHLNPAVILNLATTKTPKRAHKPDSSNSFLFTERTSLDKDPSQDLSQAGGSKVNLKVKKRKSDSCVQPKPKRLKLSSSDSFVSPRKAPLSDASSVSPLKQCGQKLNGDCSAKCQPVSPSLSPVLGSQKTRRLNKLSSCDSCQSVSLSESRLQDTKSTSQCCLREKLGRPRLSDSDSCQLNSPSKSQLQDTKKLSSCLITKELGRPRSSDSECCSVSPPESPSLPNVTKIKLPNCLVDTQQTSNVNRSCEKRVPIGSLAKKIKSESYRMSPERRKCLAALMNSDSDCDSILADGHGGSVISQRRSSRGMVNEYFQRALRYETMTKLQEKTPSKEGEDLENFQFEDLLSDCYISDETQSKPIAATEILDKGQNCMHTEIAEVKNVCDLTEEQLLYLVKKNTQYLKDIFEGKVPCQRHDCYKEGGKTRVALNYQVRLNLFSEEQPDIIVSALVATFCHKTGSKYLDYVLKVLLPEVLVKIYMDIHGTSYNDTEEAMAKARPIEQDF